MLSLLILLLLAAATSLSLTGAVRHYAVRTALLDLPNERSSHTQPTPRGGGLGFIIAFAVTTTLTSVLTGYFPQLLPTELATPNPSCLWLILTPLAITGILDDRHSLPAALRYLVQLAAAGIALTCFGPFPQPWLTSLGTAGTIAAIALTAIGMTALINLYNFMDGLDGLVAGTAAVQLCFLAIYLNQPLLWLMIAAIFGFLYWNWSPAKIFMGDAGSTVLGATVALSLLNSGSDPARSWSALAITLPLIGDAIYTLVRRLRRRENLFKAHRSHLYQRLQQSGWSHAQVACTYIGVTVLAAASISLFGPAGAWVSLAGTAGAIIVGETYLGWRSSASQ